MKFIKIIGVAFTLLFFIYLGILIVTQRYYNYRDTIHYDTIVVIDGNVKTKALRSEVHIVDKVNKVVENPTYEMARDNMITTILTAFVLFLFVNSNQNKKND